MLGNVVKKAGLGAFALFCIMGAILVALAGISGIVLVIAKIVSWCCVS